MIEGVVVCKSYILVPVSRVLKELQIGQADFCLPDEKAG